MDIYFSFMQNQTALAYHILFSGHMIDRVDRAKPRFPALKEGKAKDRISKILAQIKEDIFQKKKQPVRAIAGAACGGDILFLELCKALNIPAEIYLALPPGAFKQQSVSFAGPEWDERFERLIQFFPFHVLDNGTREAKDPTIWRDTNDWMLREALKNGVANAKLVALWDEKKGDGDGGSEHMVKRMEAEGGKPVIINTNSL